MRSTGRSVAAKAGPRSRQGWLWALWALVLCSAAHAQGPEFTVLLDPAHGGAETGTLLRAHMPEKDLVLDVANHLRSVLRARGIAVLQTRENDAAPAPDARAGAANHARPAACLVLHATASGSGAHLYTSSLAAASAPRPLVPWQAAQGPFLTQSLQLASELNTALGSAGVPVTLGRVRLAPAGAAPLDALACPAVTVELAPLRVTEHGKEEQAALDDPAYRQRVVNALAAGLVAWRAARPEARPGAGRIMPGCHPGAVDGGRRTSSRPALPQVSPTTSPRAPEKHPPRSRPNSPRCRLRGASQELLLPGPVHGRPSRLEPTL